MTRAGLLFVFSLALAAPPGAGAEEIVTVSGRADATQSYLLLHDAPPPAAVAVLFPGGIGIASFDFAAIKAPLLFVHHRYDGCGSCPYHAAENLGRTYPLITVMGGKPAESGPCEPFAAHGYFGKEAETVAAIRSWMLGQAFPKMVE